jgi:hypothetical protein
MFSSNVQIMFSSNVVLNTRDDLFIENTGKGIPHIGRDPRFRLILLSFPKSCIGLLQRRKTMRGFKVNLDAMIAGGGGGDLI